VIVYVETNFLLELAYLQERYESCEEILRLAKENAITLVLPAFCAAEARSVWRRRVSDRQEFHQAFKVHLRTIARSEPYRALKDEFEEMSDALVSGGEDVRHGLEAAVSVAADFGEVISLTAHIINLAYAIELTYSLSPQDALVLASVQLHAEQHAGPKCFVTQDVRDFSSQVVIRDLTAKGCKVIVNFDDALAHIKNALRLEGES
jgi:predicted nucleic acid-binding protein